MSIAKQFEDTLKETGHGLYSQMIREGLTLALVTNINDEDKLNRVKCLPVENQNEEETDWCYVMAPFGGKEHGQFFFPNVGDLVVLGYLGGDPHRPLVLGACWNSEVKPPYVIQDGKVHHFSIKTPSGIELLLYDEPKKQKVTITLPSGTMLAMDDEKKSVTIMEKKGENSLMMDFDKGEVTLKAKTKLTLSAGKDSSIVLESSGNIKQDATKSVKLKSAAIEGSASNKLALDGGEASVAAKMTLKLESKGTAALKGTMVNIN